MFNTNTQISGIYYALIAIAKKKINLKIKERISRCCFDPVRYVFQLMIPQIMET